MVIMFGTSLKLTMLLVYVYGNSCLIKCFQKSVIEGWIVTIVGRDMLHFWRERTGEEAVMVNMLSTLL